MVTFPSTEPTEMGIARSAGSFSWHKFAMKSTSPLIGLPVTPSVSTCASCSRSGAPSSNWNLLNLCYAMSDAPTS